MKRYGLFIDGEHSDSGIFEPVHDPQSGRILHEAAVGGEREVEAATQAACRAFAETRRLSRAARSEILSRAAAAIAERSEELAETVRAEAGKPIAL
ncbi:MAG TPA: aldehyde dehydrogenase family protein, partial [Candidatus Binatia bacterium]|nr:aldehyde dehydrogenase family protein [Candidatus Binatia bacterium]